MTTQFPSDFHSKNSQFSPPNQYARGNNKSFAPADFHDKYETKGVQPDSNLRGKPVALVYHSQAVQAYQRSKAPSRGSESATPSPFHSYCNDSRSPSLEKSEGSDSDVSSPSHFRALKSSSRSSSSSGVEDQAISKRRSSSTSPDFRAPSPFSYVSALSSLSQEHRPYLWDTRSPFAFHSQSIADASSPNWSNGFNRSESDAAPDSSSVKEASKSQRFRSINRILYTTSLDNAIKSVFLRAQLGDFAFAKEEAANLCRKRPGKKTFEALCQFERAIDEERLSEKRGDRAALHLIKQHLSRGSIALLLEEAYGICEKLKEDPTSLYVSALGANAKDLHWNIHLVHAVYLAKKRNYKASFEQLSKSLQNCPPHLHYKIYILCINVAALAGMPSDQIEEFYQQALHSLSKDGAEKVPAPPGSQPPPKRTHLEKKGYQVILARAQAEHFRKNFSAVESLLEEARTTYIGEWRTWFYSILFNLSHRSITNAKILLQDALYLFPQHGRLLSLSIQLDYLSKDDDAISEHFKEAFNAAPKSGELHCEWGRFLNNPFCKFYNPSEAERAFKTAIEFTPQFGDSFIELLALQLEQGKAIDIPKFIIGHSPSYGLLWNIFKKNSYDSPKDVLVRVRDCALSYDFSKAKADYLKSFSALGITYYNFYYANPRSLEMLEQSLLDMRYLD